VCCFVKNKNLEILIIIYIVAQDQGREIRFNFRFMVAYKPYMVGGHPHFLLISRADIVDGIINS
jgi:hypothetical protein